VQSFREQAHRCPTWAELRVVFRHELVEMDADGAPVDPTGVPYLMEPGTCLIKLNPKSEIPIK